jgi:hypothetical protein
MNDDARIDKSRGNDAQLGLGCSKSPNFNIYYLTWVESHPQIQIRESSVLMPLRPRLQWLLNPTSSARPDSRTWLLCSIGFPGLTSTDTGSRLQYTVLPTLPKTLNMRLRLRLLGDLEQGSGREAALRGARIANLGWGT